MRYSIVLASLAASAYATSFINVEVGNELNEASESLRRGSGNNGHGKDGHCADRNHGGRSRDGRNGMDRNRDDRSQDRSRNGQRGGDRSREDRRRGGREDDREHGGWFSFLKTHNGRHGSYEDRYGRCARQGQCDRNRHNDGRGNAHHDYEVLSIMDILFGADYECVTEAHTKQEEMEALRLCCRKMGGLLVDNFSRCELEDVSENPEKEWHDCTRREKGVIRSDCFRHRHENEDYRRPRQGDRRQSIISLEAEDNDDNNNQDRMQECELNITGPMKQVDTMRCCMEAHGTFFNEKCAVLDNNLAEKFRNCARESRIPADKVQCKPMEADNN